MSTADAVCTMTRTARIASSLGLLLAAASSVATSQPEPDWLLNDSAEGDITLSPDVEEVVVKLRVTSAVVDSNLSFMVKPDPAPLMKSELTQTPILFFVGSATESGAKEADLHAPVPQSPNEQGFDGLINTTVGAKEGEREFTVRISWNTPNPSDRQASDTKSTGNGSSITVTDRRESAPRQLTKIHWRATMYADGYDDRPRGAKVDVEPSP